MHSEALDGAPSLNLYGASGLIDMPSAEQQPDGTLGMTVSHFAGITRTTMSFQIAPRLSGSFRYTSIANWNPGGGLPTYYDRSFDLRYLLLREGRYRPAVTVGVQDFIGTSISAGEYLVASKRMQPRLTLSGGLGWGRYGSHGSLGTPFGARPAVKVGKGGKFNFNDLFRGPVAPFAGVEWRPTDQLGFKLEYSSDNYDREAGSHDSFKRRSPWNLGMEYRLNNSYRLGAYYLYGSEIGARLSIVLNPRDRPTKGVLGPAPAPVALRPSRTATPGAWSTSWTTTPGTGAALGDALDSRLRAEGMQIEALSVTATRAQLRLVNRRYESAPQAIGRAARVLSRVMPASVETFEIVPVVNGIPMSKVTLRRSDLERLEFAPNAAAGLRRRVSLGDAGGSVPDGAIRETALAPAFTWWLGPYGRFSYFDPDNPLRADFGGRLRARYAIRPNLFLSGSLTKKVVGNLDQSTRKSNSVLPHVRSDSYLYDKHADPDLERLTLAWYGRPGRDLYSRVTMGYLERMYGGVSGEILWKPVNSRFALGTELNYVRQRDYGGGLGFLSYKVATGHVSAYYQFGNGYFGQVDAGRYLAGDWGATVTLDRIFANGWRVGAFATLTNVSAADFGEGSFDKGIRIRIPIAWGIGHPTRVGRMGVIRPLTRDGGARLEIDGRLYESLREYHGYALDKDWGRVWR
ncbi:YjbH domain-containing protein [Acidimangrovimonas pyrenivorans]|uniref:YjbH domain-containing protein n=1 Tax=Acidimangrovimonas pyrenivorans TaxID=2030798 RepID=A0ABV7ACV9_9RHOB